MYSPDVIIVLHSAPLFCVAREGLLRSCGILTRVRSLSEAPRKVRTHTPKALHGRHKALGCNNGTSKPNPPDMYLYIIDYVVREIDPVFCVTHIESFACTP